ncbi:MAG: sulfide-dependent adenosine diphosphate thiazole synthase [Deltaproteobacteria bacterium]|nr:sulfide-dependent adenosine diphosphate thiazole synthase [Deltaproteobacteria bacterium]
MLDEILVTRAITTRYFEKLQDSLELDAAIVGGGPAGLVAGYKLARAGHKVALFERKLSVGGGMWGGGMMMNEIVVQAEAKPILDEFGVPTREFAPGYYTADSVLTTTTLCSQAMLAGLRVFNLISVEDVMVRDARVVGLVVNWTAVEMAGLHVDPLCFRCRYTIDSTGHDADVLNVISRKVDAELYTKTGKVLGERSLWAEVAENNTLDNTREAFPGVYTAGMCANAVFGSYRMGPIFGGMLLSGQKAAQMVGERLAAEK